MSEFQIRWVQNKDKHTKAAEPFKVEIFLFKIRDVVLRKKDESSKVRRFALVPLYERLRLKDS